MLSVPKSTKEKEHVQDPKQSTPKEKPEEKPFLMQGEDPPAHWRCQKCWNVPTEETSENWSIPEVPFCDPCIAEIGRNESRDGFFMPGWMLVRRKTAPRKKK